MSERAGTAEVMDITPKIPETPETTEVTGDLPAGPRPAEPELATADLLVEEVSIDGMCGVY